MKVPFCFSALASSKPGSGAIEAATQILVDIWDYDAEDHTFICTRRAGGGGWHTHPIRGDRGKHIRKILQDHPARLFDIYFCPNAFSQPSRLKEFALPSRYAWNDIDGYNPDLFEPRPNILWESSPGRYQGLWIWRNAAAGLIAEQYSKNLWSRYGGDSGGWSITKMLRLPGTTNHKPEYSKPFVRLIRYDATPQRLPMKLAFVRMSSFRDPTTANPELHEPAEVLRRYGRAVGLEVCQLIRANTAWRPDRSKRVFQIVAALVDAGADDDQIASILWVNPYFVEKWGQDVAAIEAEIGRIRGRRESGR